MKSILLSFLITCGAGIASNAQFAIWVDPPTFTRHGESNDTDIEYEVHIANISGVTDSLYWSKRLTSGPVEWFSWICDINQCYLPDAIACDPDLPNVITAGDTVVFSMHINPRNIEGTGTLSMTLFDDQGNQMQVVVGEYVVGEPSSAGVIINLPQVGIYPNPVRDAFAMTLPEDASNITLFDMTGRLIRELDAKHQTTWDVSSIQPGMYALILYDESNKPVGRSTLVKQ